MRRSGREGNIKMATDFYAVLYSDEESNLPFYTDSPAAYVPWILLEKTELVIKHLNQTKIPGPHTIDEGLLKLGPQALISHLTKLFKNVLMHKIVPAQWLN